jgi:phospholipase C
MTTSANRPRSVITEFCEGKIPFPFASAGILSRVLAITAINHVFVLMLENRSFDHMLGFSNLRGRDASSGQPTQIAVLQGNKENTYQGAPYPCEVACGFFDDRRSGPRIPSRNHLALVSSTLEEVRSASCAAN